MKKFVTTTCQCELNKIKSLLKEYEVYLAFEDWINAHFLASVISNRVKILVAREHERKLERKLK